MSTRLRWTRATSLVNAPAHPRDVPGAPRVVCRGQEDGGFFLGRGEWARAARVRALCHACPLLAACRDWAIPITDLDGFWAGMTALQRRRARAARRRHARCGGTSR